MTILTVSLPTIGHELHFGETALRSIVSLQVPAGALLIGAAVHCGG